MNRRDREPSTAQPLGHRLKLNASALTETHFLPEECERAQPMMPAPVADDRTVDMLLRTPVAGESYRQDELVRITGRRGSEAVKIENVELELVCEPDNEHDPRAVKVLAQGLHAGYLSKGNGGPTAPGEGAVGPFRRYRACGSADQKTRQSTYSKLSAANENGSTGGSCSMM